MKSNRRKIADACYFRSVTRADRLALTEELSTVSNLSQADCRYHARTRYPLDYYKLILFFVQLASIVTAVVVLLFFGSPYLSTAWLVVLYDVLPPVFLLLLLGGLVLRRIEVKEYLYHWMSLLFQLLLMAAAFLRMLYVLAKAVEPF